jgi:hypothetical protein
LRPPLPRRYDETVARGSAAEEHLDIRRQARDGRRGGDCGSFCGGIAAVACCLLSCCGDRTVGGLLAGRAAATWAWAWRKWWRRCPLFVSRGAGLAGVLFWSALRPYVCAQSARAG